MKCPFCGSDKNEVIESRVVEKEGAIRRRRQCRKCKKRFTTFERARKETIWIIKKDSRREQFDREKLRRGILRAVEKRPISLELVDEIVDSVEREILKKEAEEISSKLVGREILKKLKKIDRVAWLRFASVYLEFEDLKDFEKIIEKER